MSLEELEAYANLYNCEDSSSDDELSGGSLMGGKMARKNLIRMMQGGTLTGGAANEWITFIKTYRESKPEAKMDEMRNAYYESRGEVVPSKKPKKKKNEGYSLQYLLSRNVKPAEMTQRKEIDYLLEVFKAANSKYKSESLKNLSDVIMEDEYDIIEDLESYSQSMAKLNKAQKKAKLAEKRLQKSLKNPNSRASKALLGEAIIHRKKAAPGSSKKSKTSEKSKVSKVLETLGDAIIQRKKAAPDFPLKAEAGVADLISALNGAKTKKEKEKILEELDNKDPEDMTPDEFARADLRHFHKTGRML